MNIKSKHGEGSHLTLDVFDADKNLLDDEAFVKESLIKLADVIDMSIISGPTVIKHQATKKEDSGITGFVIIAESHISIHTYPLKKFMSVDIFSCKEFDYNKATEFIREQFKAGNITQNILSRGYSQSFSAEDKCEVVKGFELDKDIRAIDLLNKLTNIGFQATHLGKSVEIIKKIKNDKATLFLSMTSNMISSGLREIIAQLVKLKIIDVIVTSTGAIEEDLMKAKKPFLLGDFNMDDVDLHRKEINRIGNILVPSDRYALLEDELIPFFNEMYERQKKTNKMISPQELIFELGKKIKDENSFLYWATKNNIPVFCPGITDGALGLQLYFFKQKNKDFGIDVTADMKKLADITLTADKTAGIFLGGGIAKHHTLGVNILREGLDYAIYVSTATEGDGSLSGARPKEAKSWSKLKEDANNVYIEADATIVFPLIALALKESYGK